MSNYPPGVSLSDPHFGPDDEFEGEGFCDTCKSEQPGTIQITGSVKCLICDECGETTELEPYEPDDPYDTWEEWREAHED